MTHRTEQVYDDEIAPLVTKLIEICKREDLPLLVAVGMLLVDAGPAPKAADGYHSGVCTTLLAATGGPDPALAGSDPRLAGVRNRMVLACELLRASNPRLDWAAGMRVSRFREGTPQDVIDGEMVAITIRHG